MGELSVAKLVRGAKFFTVRNLYGRFYTFFQVESVARCTVDVQSRTARVLLYGGAVQHL